MKHRSKPERSRKSKKITAFLSSALIVAAALIYMVFGDQIAGLLEEYGLDYSKLSSLLTNDVADGELEVHIIDVGQGDSILVRSKDGVILIDSGPNSAEEDLRTHLNACGIKAIDYFICTHPHEDHIGGADMILNTYEVGTLIMPETDVSTVTVDKLLDALEAHEVGYESPVVGAVYTLGDISFTILAPDESLNDGGNNSSIVLRLKYGSTYFMFTGDAEAITEQMILDRFPAYQLRCDFLKVGHHGSYTSTTEEFLTAVSPEYAAISCEKGNSYGHPHRETLNLLSKYGITGDKLLRTDTMGTIIVISDGSELRVES